ncbi:MAG: S1 RNA-binding domain-containing protein, partial [Bradymonadaceae bacterium]
MSNDENDSQNEESSPSTAEAIRRQKLEESADEEEADEQEKEAGMPGYASEHEPGGKVRVARSTRGVEDEPEEPSEDEADEETEGDQEAGSQFEVTVRGEGTTVEADESGSSDTSSEGAASSDAHKAEKTADTATPERETSADAEQTAPSPSTGGGADREEESGSDSFEPDIEMDDLAGGDEESATTEDFAEMFEQGAAVPEQREYETGDRVDGEVLEIGDRYIFVQLDPQTEGAAKRRAFENEEGEVELEIGDTHEFYVTDVDTDAHGIRRSVRRIR